MSPRNAKEILLLAAARREGQEGKDFNEFLNDDTHTFPIWFFNDPNFPLPEAEFDSVLYPSLDTTDILQLDSGFHGPHTHFDNPFGCHRTTESYPIQTISSGDMLRGPTPPDNRKLRDCMTWAPWTMSRRSSRLSSREWCNRHSSSFCPKDGCTRISSSNSTQGPRASPIKSQPSELCMSETARVHDAERSEQTHEDSFIHPSPIRFRKSNERRLTHVLECTRSQRQPHLKRFRAAKPPSADDKRRLSYVSEHGLEQRYSTTKQVHD
jgi:hypothetical protein